MTLIGAADCQDVHHEVSPERLTERNGIKAAAGTCGDDAVESEPPTKKSEGAAARLVPEAVVSRQVSLLNSVRQKSVK